MIPEVVGMLTLPATVYRRVAGAVDDYGNPVTSFVADPGSKGCWVDLRGRTTESSEVKGDAQWLIDTVDLYIRDETITGFDEVEVTLPTGVKQRFEMLGNPQTFVDPLTVEVVYTACVARRIT